MKRLFAASAVPNEAEANATSFDDWRLERRKYAAELVALAPDVIFVSGSAGVEPLRRRDTHRADRVRACT